ncbi:MAG: cyclic nucleotide-binding/CBS domain-containing protein [Leptospirillia bacterium]
MLTIKDVLTKNVITASLDTKVRELAELMDKKRIGSVFVTSENGDVVGIVTESDVVRKVVAGDRIPYVTTAADVMSTPLISINIGENIFQAQELMDKKRVLHLAVKDGEEFVGMVSIRDLIHPYESFERGTSWV